MSEKINLECVQGDITNQSDLDVVVNAANAQLRTGGGVAGAIHRAAGPKLEEACRPMAPINPGDAVISPAFDMPNKKIIHTLGPVYNVDKPSDQLLADCYRNSLMLADREKLTTIGFPAISTGAFGYPVQEAAEVSAYVVHSVMAELHQIALIRFVLFSDTDYATFRKAFGIK